MMTHAFADSVKTLATCLARNARDLFQLQASAPGDRQIGERLFKSARDSDI